MRDLAVLDLAPVAVLVVRRSGVRLGRVVRGNPAAAALLGRSARLLPGTPVTDLLGTCGLECGSADRRTDLLIPGDPARWVSASAVPLPNRVGRGLALVVLHDVTDRRRGEQRAEQLARTDPLTGLLNRAGLGWHLGPGGLVGPAVVIVLDLDGFKQVNDRFGHQVGDEVLAVVAARLRAVVRPDDALARIGGDEFVLVCQGVADPVAARALADRVRDTLAEPVVASGEGHQLGMAVGVVLAGSGPLDGDALRHVADRAMYRSKASGRVELATSGDQAD